jgi:hypothetical protein
MKLENRLKLGVIMWFFVRGSKFRARWQDWIINSWIINVVFAEKVS